MENIEELCCYYIGFLRSVGMVHQNNHWITSGKNFYGNHLLFEKIYSSAQKDVDLMAEKFIGVFNSNCLNLMVQSKVIHKILDKYCHGHPIESSLKIETDFIEFCQHFYDTLKKENALTLGLDDSIMAVSSSREEAVYLLKQAKDDGSNSVIDNITARTNILKKIKSKK